MEPNPHPTEKDAKLIKEIIKLAIRYELETFVGMIIKGLFMYIALYFVQGRTAIWSLQMKGMIR